MQLSNEPTVSRTTAAGTRRRSGCDRLQRLYELRDHHVRGAAARSPAKRAWHGVRLLRHGLRPEMGAPQRDLDPTGRLAGVVVYAGCALTAADARRVRAVGRATVEPTAAIARPSTIQPTASSFVPLPKNAKTVRWCRRSRATTGSGELAPCRTRATAAPRDGSRVGRGRTPGWLPGCSTCGRRRRPWSR